LDVAEVWLPISICFA